MNKKIPFLFLTVFAIGCAGGAKFNESNIPVAPIEETSKIRNIYFEKMRIQILDEGTFRFEYVDPSGEFLDKNTFFIPNRTQYKGIKNYSTRIDNFGMHIYFQNIEIRIAKNCKEYRDIKIFCNDELIFDGNNGIKDLNDGDLPDPGNTPDVFQVVDNPRIIIPEHGYSPLSIADNPRFADTNGYEIQMRKDLYLLLPLRNARKLRQQYINLTGQTEMVRLSTLGAWDSRYFEYNEHTAQLEVDNYHKYNLPLDNLVIDTDWRIAASGTGYDVNTDLFPDMARFLRNMHSQNIEVCFNDHPEPVQDSLKRRLNVFEPSEVKFRSDNLSRLLNMGLDYWWYDRNWGVRLESPIERHLSHETLGDYLFHDVTKRTFYEKFSDEQGHYRRPIMMGNVDNINSGNIDHIKNTASHRYSIQWTGDISPHGLAQEIKNVIYTGNRCIPYMSSDLSGHTGVASDYYYNRWIQYGALSPIFRIHCTRDLAIHCQPWFRDPDDNNGVMKNFRNFINMRYRLLPLFYNLSHENYLTGMPICRSLRFDYPYVSDLYAEKEWMVGDNILFAPESQEEYVKLGLVDKAKCEVFAGKATFEDKRGEFILDNNFLDFPNGDLFKIVDRYGMSHDNFTLRFTGKIKTNDKPLRLCCAVDDGARIYCKKSNETNWTTYIDAWKDQALTTYEAKKTLDPNTTYDIKVEYYQAGNEAIFRLLNKLDLTNPDAKIASKIYLPEGRWFDVYHNNILEGEKVHDIEFGQYEAPIFVKLGAITPLVNEADNTKHLDWSKMTLDVYPGNNKMSSTIYEDDTTSTAYKDDIYRLTPYRYNGDDNGNVTINLDSSIGDFTGGSATNNKTYYIRYHDIINPSANVSFKVDGKAVTPQIIDASSEYMMPFAFNDKPSYGHKTYCIAIDTSIRKPHQISIIKNA